MPDNRPQPGDQFLHRPALELAERLGRFEQRVLDQVRCVEPSPGLVGDRSSGQGVKRGAQRFEQLIQRRRIAGASAGEERMHHSRDGGGA